MKIFSLRFLEMDLISLSVAPKSHRTRTIRLFISTNFTFPRVSPGTKHSNFNYRNKILSLSKHKNRPNPQNNISEREKEKSTKNIRSKKEERTEEIRRQNLIKEGEDERTFGFRQKLSVGSKSLEQQNPQKKKDENPEQRTWKLHSRVERNSWQWQKKKKKRREWEFVSTEGERRTKTKRLEVKEEQLERSERDRRKDQKFNSAK